MKGVPRSSAPNVNIQRQYIMTKANFWVTAEHINPFIGVQEMKCAG
jgi:hypothetical protein